MRSVFDNGARLPWFGAAIAVFGCSGSVEANDPSAEGVESDPSISLLTGGELASIARGALAFVDRNPHGLGSNGRACADCHTPADGLQLSPARAETRFQALQRRRRLDPNADDPLFRPIDADDFRTNGAAAREYSNLRQNGLIRITFTLPPTVRLIDPLTDQPSTETFVDVWRAVPTVNNVKLTGPDANPPSWPCPVGAPPDPPCVPRGPNANGGYQLDARIANLQDQALAAFANHAETTNAPSTRLLDDLANFQNSLFSSEGLRATSRAIDQGVTPIPDPDPPLDALAQQGKVKHSTCPPREGLARLRRTFTTTAPQPSTIFSITTPSFSSSWTLRPPPSAPTGSPLPRPPLISTDGVHVDRPFTLEERPALLAYLRKL
jgi:hypothetical protein